ncbi:MAG: hypothetical protein HONBIEJF_01405 [Fimbriimonadaceae bacterium]|nr:hypothetical protein [Fimbriimonadaceae bacterium]
MKGIQLILVVIAALAVAGCGKKEPEMVRLGDKAPEMSGAIEAFIVGQWAETDNSAALGEAIGMKSPPSEEPEKIGSIYVFRADKTFDLIRSGKKEKIAGKWQTGTSGVFLEYLTIDGLSIEKFSENARKEAERGTQSGIAADILLDWLKERLAKQSYLEVDGDKRRLVFKQSSGGDPNDPASALASIGIVALERIGEEKK